MFIRYLRIGSKAATALGLSGIGWICSLLATRCPLLLVFQLIQLLDLDGLALSEQRDDDGEADRDLGGGDGQDEKHEDVAIERAVEARESDERDCRGDEHQLQTHVDHERVLAQQHAEEADREEQGAQDDVIAEGTAHLMSPRSACFLLSTITPSIAITCTGSR